MYQIPELLKYPKLLHAFSEVKDGNMANSILGKAVDFDQVLENRKKFFKKIKIPINKTVAMWVLGSDSFQIAQEEDVEVSILNYQRAVKTDGLVTNQKGLYLMLLVADCAPVIIYDPVRSVVALVHVGWKGADLEIVKKVVIFLAKKYKSNPNDLVIGIGPAARKKSFIKENPVQKDDPRWNGFVNKIEDNFYSVDFVGLIKKQLKDVGVNNANVIDCEIDTVINAGFYSHYLNKDEPLSEQGRFACVVGLI